MKGYRIYWPTKRTISVKRNVVINDNDVTSADNITLDSGDILAEGEREEIIQSIPKSSEDSEDPNSLPKTDSQSKQDEEEVDDEPLPSNTIPFPSTQPETAENVPEITNVNQTQAYGRGQCKPPEPGAYKAMNDGLVATIAKEVNLQDINNLSEYSQNDDLNYLLPPDFAFVGNLCSEPKTLDEALQGSGAKEWQTALDYKIGQLEKLGTWVVEDLPKGQSAIPCGEVLKIKRGLDGEVKGYRVRIVARGHRQVKGVNYTEMFSSAAKMPTVHLILANAAEQDWAIEQLLLGITPVALLLSFENTKYLTIEERMKKMIQEREEALAAHKLARS